MRRGTSFQVGWPVGGSPEGERISRPNQVRRDSIHNWEVRGTTPSWHSVPTSPRGPTVTGPPAPSLPLLSSAFMASVTRHQAGLGLARQDSC